MEKAAVCLVVLLDLRPNNWYINKTKLEQVRKAWRQGDQDLLPPVLVARIDGDLSLIDGHSRALVAYQQGRTQIKAQVQDLDAIEGSKALYTHIHREGSRRGIRTIADLENRVLDARQHRKTWVGYCTRWIEENEADTRPP